MSILLQSRLDLFEKPGGDTHQILKTKEYLEKLGVTCTISTELMPNITNFDIVHIFNITRPYETYIQIQNAKKQNKKVVFSPLYQDFNEWDRKGRYGFQKLVLKIVSNRNAKEFLKNTLRFTLSKYKSVLTTVISNRYEKLQKIILQSADLLVLTAETEMDVLKRKFNIEKPYYVIYNGVDETFTNASSETFVKKYGIKNFVLCVANFSSIKNHLNLIKAIQPTDLQLVLIGNSVKFHNSYFKLLKKESKKTENITVLTNISKDIIASAYATAKVHILASWFETCGLSNLEAGLSGCNIVTTNRGYAKEYFKDMAWYCSPDDIESIRRAILEAYNAPRVDKLKNYIFKNFAWEKTAEDTLKAYNMVLNG